VPPIVLRSLPTLPASPEAFRDAGWTDLLPYYDALAAAPLSAESASSWLAAWSRLEELIDEAATLASIAYTCDTGDGVKEAAHLRFASEIAPKQAEQNVRLARRLLDLGWSSPELDTVIRRFRTDAEIFREENVPLFAESSELETDYDRITGGLTVEWEGQVRTVPQLQPVLKSPVRALRERAFRLGADAYLAERDGLADLFDRMYESRQRIARNAGFADFRDFVFRAKYRFDYTPADCERFHRAVEAAVVPAAERLFAWRREKLGVDTLRPWDLAINPGRDGALVPFASAAEFVEHGRRIFARVDPEFGDWFDDMAQQGLLDLESRPGKAPGGYCATLPFRGMPFVFMNAVGVPDDVNTLVHEAGHCFHAILSHRLPNIFQRATGMEAAELASMSMELLAARFLVRPDGYYAPPDVRHAWLEHLEDIITSLAHIACVDAFQHWIYTDPEGADPEARDAAWLEIRARFERGVDWSGLDRERIARWYRQSHIFTAPFYYIEYGLAQCGALQIWRDSLSDYPGAVARYKSALALGGTRPLPEIYATAGARLMFDAEGMRALIDLIERRIEELRAMTP
jgi:oligoendopeptidase F